MKKKLISLVLAMVMIVACFAGCGQKDDEEAAADINEAASENAMTLVMYLLADEKVSDDRAAAIQTAVNKITKSKFKTQLELRFFTEDEYYEKLEAAFAQRATEGNGQTSNNESGEDETVENKWGIVEIKYPSVSANQVDIFYLGDTKNVSGQDKYNEYADAKLIQRLDEEISSSSKLLNSYITPSILKGVKEASGATLAIPNNFVIGEYTYLLVNKKALADLSYDTDKGLAEFTSLTSNTVKNFLSDVQKYKIGNTTDYTHALYSDIPSIELASAGVHFWGIDENGNLSSGFSALASDINPNAVYGQTSSYMNGDNYVMTDVFNTAFYKQLRTIKEYEAYDFASEAAASAFAEGKVAVACINGGADIPDKYADDYEAIVVGRPTLNEEDLYRSMFAVSSYSSSMQRSMEIITYLNTNEDFRNLIQYGICDTVTDLLDSNGEQVKGRDYKLVESDYIDPDTGKPFMMVERIPDSNGNFGYVMNVNKTGNTFIAYPTVDDNPLMLGYYKKQNTDAMLNLTMGFRLNYNGYQVNMEALEELRALSAEILEKLLACTAENFDAVVDEMRESLAEGGDNNECIKVLIDFEESINNPQSLKSLAFIYNEWGTSKKICTKFKLSE